MTDRRLDFTTGQLFANRYELMRELGAGGMGKVYLVKDRMLEGEELALKILLPELSADATHTKRFLREVQLTRKVTHPNVVRTYDVGQDGELLYFTLEYVDGKPLTDFILKDPMGAYETALIMLQVCRGLSAIHEQGIIHRDLKPANILLTRNGIVKIADFGIARPNVSQLTSHEEVVGSAPYMAPEIWRGTDIGAPADIYALGAMVYELLTGAWPFDGETAAQVMCKHLEEVPVPPYVMKSNVPVWLGQLVSQMMSKDARERPDMDEIGKELIKYLPELRQEWHSSGAHGRLDGRSSGEIYISSLITGTEIATWEDNYAEYQEAHYGEVEAYVQETKPPERSPFGGVPTIDQPALSENVRTTLLDALVSLVQFCLLSVAACVIFWALAGPAAQFMHSVLETTGRNSNAIKSVAVLFGPILITAAILGLPFLIMVNRKNDLLVNVQTYGRMVWGIFILAGFVFITHVGVQIAGMDGILQKSGFSFMRPAEQAFSAVTRAVTLTPDPILGRKGAGSMLTTHAIFLFFVLVYFTNLITVIRRDILLVKSLGRNKEMALAAGMSVLFAAEYFYLSSRVPGEAVEIFKIAAFSFTVQQAALGFAAANWLILIGGVYGALLRLERRNVQVYTDSLVFNRK